MRKGFLKTRAGSLVDAGTDAADDVSAPDGEATSLLPSVQPKESSPASTYVKG